LFVNVLRYKDNPNITNLLEEATAGRNSYYIVSYADVSEPKTGKILERIWIDRLDLQVVRKQMFGADGRLETDVEFSEWHEVDDTPLPQVILIRRPVDDASLKITLQRTTLNETMTAEQFQLDQPPGSELVQVDNPGPKPF
jgi:hypothetical protein